MLRAVAGGALAFVLLLGLGAAAPAQTPQAVLTIKMSMVSYKFVPDIVTLHDGQHAVLQLSNDDPQPRAHSFASLFLNTASYTVTGPAKQGVTPDGIKYIAARGETGVIVVWPAGYRPAGR
jgi:hypothetical protein